MGALSAQISRSPSEYLRLLDGYESGNECASSASSWMRRIIALQIWEISCAIGKDGKYPDGWADKPVTWVSIEDARAYAHWAGKRLPHEWEWQYAAQSADGRKYPWGNAWNADAVTGGG